MTEKIKSAFLAWFEAQHGPRPHKKDNHFDLLSQVKAGELASMKLNEINDWNNRRESALYAWQASESFHVKSQNEKAPRG